MTYYIHIFPHSSQLTEYNPSLKSKTCRESHKLVSKFRLYMTL